MTQSYFRAPISKSLSSQDLHAKGQLLVKAGSLNDLAMVLGFEEKWIREQAVSPAYYSFKAPKGNGSTRQIDNPNPKLKDFLRVLADLLQGLYYGVRPRAAYAFIPTVSDQTNPLNIYTNALQHCKSKWVLQLDLKNFFHSITIHRIRELFLHLPFKFPEDTAQVLAKVCTFQNRLPIGAPTSPVLSNFVCFELDHRLDKMAREYDWTYTRYADDLTFSGPRKFTNDSVELIRKEIEDQEFVLNTEKTAHHRIQDEPEVCGLALKPDGKPDLSEQFIKDLKADIKTYKHLVSNKMIAQEIFTAEALLAYRRHIDGQLAFVRFIKGPHHALYLKFRFALSEGLLDD